MLAERKKRVKWSLNPRGNLWSQDANKFGQRMLEKMGWKPGCGLGANEQGMTENIKVTYKSDNKCIGYKEHGEEWIDQQSQFESLLAELGDSHDTTVSDNGDKGNESLELRSRQSRSRVHYQKFTRGKDISKYSDKDLACILGVKKTSDIADYSTVTEETNVDNSIGNADNLYGVMTVNGGSMSIYFSKKKQKNVDSAPEENHEEREQEGWNLGDNVCEAKTERKRKQKHEHSEGLCIQQTEVDGQEREGNELALKKKKRKLKDGDHLLKEDEIKKQDERINDGETHTKLNGEKDVYNSQAGNNSYEHEPITKRKKKQKEDCINIVGTHGNEVGQETDGLNYKKKKRKFKVEAEEQENLPMEAGAMKEDGRICGEASNNEQYIEENSCEVGYESCMQEPKINSKEKRKQKDNEGPDAHEDEPITKSKKKRKEKDIQNLDTHRHEVGLETDGNNANSLNYKKKKRKLKVEAEEQENLPKEDEAIKRDGRICGEDSNNEHHIEKDKVYDSCVLKTKGNGKKKRKQKDDKGPDVDETQMTLLNGNSATDLRSRKKKRKMKERMEDENSVNQTGNECIPGPTANEIEEISDHKNDKSNKIKKIKKSVDIDTEEAVYHSEMNDNEFLEKETTKHKINGVQNSNKKKKIKKNKDVTTCNSQEHYEPVQCNVEEPHAEGCDRTNREGSLDIGEASISINCENDAGKRKKKKGKTMYETDASERIEEQDTEMNQHKSESTVENNEFLNEIKDFRNVEGSSKKVKNNCKQEQDVCNSDTQNSAGANFRTAGIRNSNIYRRNMKPSAFAQLVHPSLIKFRGSNLHKVPGYGCYWV